MMGRLNAMIFGALCGFMLPSFILCLCDKDGQAALAFGISIALTGVLALILAILCRGASVKFYAREGLICVGICWLGMSLLGALPFRLSGCFDSYIDALFEIASGFSTTGASVLSDVECLPRGILFWRSFSHWVGGMGVLIFLLAIVPISGKNQGFTLHLMRAESPGPDVGKLVPKMRSTAAILYICYLVLTVLNVVFLLIGGMSFFEALCTAFGTAGTGGFGLKNDSIGGYSPYIQVVTTVFMLLFGVNFSCYFLIAFGKFRAVLKDEELRAYGIIVLGSTLAIALRNLFGAGAVYGTFGESLRHAAFQVGSIMTTTGFSTADFDLWPTFSKAILALLMLIGASAGSTGGGFKVSRFLLILKGARRNLSRVLHPDRVKSIRLCGKPVDEKVLSNTNGYLAAYLAILIVSFLIVSFDRAVSDMTTSMTACIACFNNIGPGFSGVGPTRNFGDFSVVSKLVLIFDMLAGRLEIFPMLVLLSPAAWRRA
ncbi:MAG: TrkH family potassium uptake protein [Clostridia bacterium]|nr:TrkH family potassium uptake protein [Clostridia bacterium]